MAFGHAALTRAANYMDAAGGDCEIATAKLLRVLRCKLIALQEDPDVNDGPDDGPDDPDDPYPLLPSPSLPSEILDAFKLREPAE